MDQNINYFSKSSQTIIILVFCLLGLIALLIFLYKKLNKEADEEYTIRNLVYKKGGIRDQVRGASLAVGTRLGIQVWPRSDTDEYGEEMQEIQDEGRQVEEDERRGSQSKGEAQEEEEQHGETKREGDSSSDDSACVEVGEQTRLTGQSEANEGMEEKGEEKEEKVEEEGSKGNASGGPELLIDLKQFSGSAIWSGEEGGSRDVTAL